MKINELQYNHYIDVAKQMAIRHPDVLSHTIEYILTGFMKNINKEINDFLYDKIGIDFSYIDYKEDENGEPIEVVEYSFDNFNISIIPKYEYFIGGKINSMPIEKDIIEPLPNKLLPPERNKNGLMISSINEDLFRWYDAYYKISKDSLYKMDTTKEKASNKKRQLKILHHNILNKNWQNLLYK